MKVINSEKVHIKSWVTDIEKGALEQAKNLANLPFAYHHVALMPDCHQGYGMPIGGVLATDGVVIPNAVGVDIGCGMRVCKTNLHISNVTRQQLLDIIEGIKAVVPVGFNKHKEENTCLDVLSMMDCSPLIEQNWENAGKSLGTLGGGNHFIELQKDEDGLLYVMLHSGSRNLGKQVCDYYNKVAEKLNKQWYSNVQKDLAFLPFGSDEASDYLYDMGFCVAYAKLNRQIMMLNIKYVIAEIAPEVQFKEDIDVAHNYARLENHYGKNVMVHRKGATSAKMDEIGIIPGSQGTASYIVKGLGNKDSFMSCSHGAGRKMGRKVAQKTLDLDREVKRLNDKGIIHSIRTVKDLDEASGAYKNITQVMKDQKDLVSIVTKLSPIGVVKG